MIDRLKRDSSNDVSISRVYFTYEKRIRMRVKRENWKGRGGGGEGACRRRRRRREKARYGNKQTAGL